MQLVLQHWCKTSCIVVLRVFLPTFEPVLLQLSLKGFFFVGGKTRNIAFLLVLQQSRKTSSTFLLQRFIVIKLLI